jgi:predicted nucleotidyltransferase
MEKTKSAIDELEERLGVYWEHIRTARETTAERRATLSRAFEGRVAVDTSVALFGSIAREEMTSGSDADWILLADGQSCPEHKELTFEVARILHENKFGEPGRSGVFGTLVGSHSLVHEIGGEDDTNSNTTRRVLLLLESFAVGRCEAYDRVRRQILNRYVRDDRGLIYGRGATKVPRFFLNDLTRYWRTITVDFVYKQRADAGKKWALRNAKLRMSRKLVFTSGLLRCFFCQLDPEAEKARAELAAHRDPAEMLRYLDRQLNKTPLELLAEAASRPKIPETTARKLFNSYDAFLGILNNQEQRDELASLIPDQMGPSRTWKQVRTISEEFQAGLTELFYGPDEELASLIREYGVF